MLRSKKLWLIAFCFNFTFTLYTQEKPNILWITIEDLTPMLGCYGDPVALTPTLDHLAAEGVKFTHAFAPAAVCSPARSCIITGMYAPTLGTQHLRSETKVPREVKGFSHYLRKAGYYCTNNYKEDYNFELSDAWDESSKNAHWRNRASDQPFFAVFNFGTTHQSQIFGSDSAYQKRFAPYLKKIKFTNPDQINLPPYSFDTPEIRKLWARYYDNVQIVDLQISELLKQLESDGLQDNTIIFFYADHGTGMPRGKRALYDSGTRVPLIIKAPLKFQDKYALHPGTVRSDLVSFIDLAPTMLTMLDLPVPEQMIGRPFLSKESFENDFVFATSDRVDEAFECSRSIRTERYRYIRNYYPQRPLIQPNYYSDQSEISAANRQELEKRYHLTSAQSSMWSVVRPVEELYDLTVDPSEANNLADDPYYQGILLDLRKKNKAQIISINDSGFAPEPYMYSVSHGSTPFETLKSQEIFPLKKILDHLDHLFFEDPSLIQIRSGLQNPHPLIQYWTLIWLQYQPEVHESLISILKELISAKPDLISVTAAETLSRHDLDDATVSHLLQVMQSDNPYLQLMATRAFELLPEKSDQQLSSARKIWQELANSTEGKWMGYDLYAYWSLCQVFDPKRPD